MIIKNSNNKTILAQLRQKMQVRSSTVRVKINIVGFNSFITILIRSSILINDFYKIL
jgi:hypothetical protein